MREAFENKVLSRVYMDAIPPACFHPSIRILCNIILTSFFYTKVLLPGLYFLEQNSLLEKGV